MHAIAHKRGITHEELREAGDVESLKDLSVVDAAKLIDRLQTDAHRKDWTPDAPDRVVPGTIRNASDRQRTYIQALFQSLGWDADKAAGWLERRHGISDLAGGVYTSRTASEAIVQLEQALKKGGEPGGDPDEYEAA